MVQAAVPRAFPLLRPRASKHLCMFVKHCGSGRKECRARNRENGNLRKAQKLFEWRERERESPTPCWAKTLFLFSFLLYMILAFHLLP